jgi:hypothetical protein
MNHAAIELISLFFAGILAGTETVIHYAVNGSTELLDDRPQILLRQALILRLRWLVPAFFIPTAILSIIITILEHSARGALFRYVGLLAILVWILVRAVGTVRINAATLTWQAETPPADWKERIASAERFHIVGTWAAIAIFACYLLAAALSAR